MSLFKKIPIDSLIARWKSLLAAQGDAGATVADAYVDMAKVMAERDANLGTMLAKGLNFDDNFDANIVAYTSNATPDTEDTVAHGLDRLPLYFIVVSIDKPGVVYASSAFDGTNLKLKCSAASAAISLLVF